MQDIANVLGTLPDQATRGRVIQWMAERFGVDVAGADAPSTGAATADHESAVTPPATNTPAPAITTVFTAARGAKDVDVGGDDLDDLFEPSATNQWANSADYWRVDEQSERPNEARDAEPTASAPPADKTTEHAEPVESMIHSFVLEFRKLADDWSGSS
jgi:hypothetical protein